MYVGWVVWTCCFVLVGIYDHGDSNDSREGIFLMVVLARVLLVILY